MKKVQIGMVRRTGDGMPDSRSDPMLLVKMAAAEFAEHGYEGMSMRTLAEKCSMSTAAIYYHFGSKEALYSEVCRNKFDEMTYAMRQQLGKARNVEERLEAFVNTLYDEWHRDNTLLLLTQRDVINALISPHHCIAESHYEHLMGMVHKILATYLDRELDQDFSFTFGSLLYGYCSLMSFDQKASKMSTDDYRQHRKKVLLKYCRQIWTSMAAIG